MRLFGSWCGSHIRGRVLAPIVDAPAVQQAFAAGVGATIRTTVGGACDPRRFQPLPVEAACGYCLTASSAANRSAGPGTRGPPRAGSGQPHARRRHAAGKPVRRSWFLRRRPGSPTLQRGHRLKSPHCEPHMFAAWCAKLINVDAPRLDQREPPQPGSHQVRSADISAG